MLGRESNHTLRRLLGCGSFATILTQKTDRLPSKSQTMGGSLSIIAEFPDRKPVMLSGIAALDTKQPMPTSHKR